MSSSHTLFKPQPTNTPNPSIDFTSTISLEALVQHIIEGFQKAIYSSLFSTEENTTFYSAILTLNTFLEFEIKHISDKEYNSLAHRRFPDFLDEEKLQFANKVGNGRTLLITESKNRFLYQGRKLVQLRSPDNTNFMSEEQTIEEVKKELHGLPETTPLTNKFKYLTEVVTGTLLKTMATSDDRYGRQACFNHQLLYPHNTLIEIEKIANVKRFEETSFETCQKMGKKILGGEITFDIALLEGRPFASKLIEKSYLKTLLSEFLPNIHNQCLSMKTLK